MVVPCGRCSATCSRCAAAAGAGVRRCGSPTASRATSCRSTSVGMGFLVDPAAGRRRVVHGVDLHGLLSPALLRVADAPPDDRGGDRRVRSGVGVLRRRVRHGDPRQPVGGRRRRRSAGASVEPGVRRVRPGPRVRGRPGPGAVARRTSRGWSGRCSSCAARSSPARPSSISPTRSAGPRRGAGSGPGMRVHGTTQRRPVEVFAAEEQPRLLPAPTAVYDVPIYATAEGASGPSRRGRQGALLGAGQPDRRPGRGPRRPSAGADLPPRPAGQGPSPPATRAAAPPTPPTCPQHNDRLRDA